MIRHREVSRLEGFSDAVFGFALTLLVVNLDTPEDAVGLRNLMGSFLPFALMFAMVVWIWYQHNQFFRRYGLQDAWTVFLNSALLFVVLFYVYPLKFLTLALIGPVLMTSGYPSIAQIEGPYVMTVYSLGVVVVFLCFVLLHLHARARAVQLELSAYDLTVLRYSLRSHLISMGLGVVSLVLVGISPNFTGWAGIVYVLMGPLHGWNGYQAGRAKAAFDA